MSSIAQTGDQILVVADSAFGPGHPLRADYIDAVSDSVDALAGACEGWIRLDSTEPFVGFDDPTIPDAAIINLPRMEEHVYSDALFVLSFGSAL